MGNKHIRGVSIIGAGLMGHGIAIEFAIAGYDVRLHSRSEQSLDRARGMIGESLQRLRELGSVSGEQAELAPACIRRPLPQSASIRAARRSDPDSADL